MLIKNTSARGYHIAGEFIAPLEEKEVPDAKPEDLPAGDDLKEVKKPGPKPAAQAPKAD